MRLAQLLAAVALLAGAAPAAAVATQPDVIDYEVVIEGSASYNRADAYQDRDGETTGHHDHAFTFRSTIPHVRFTQTRAEVVGGALGTGQIVRSHFALNGPDGERFTCEGAVAADVEAGGLVPTTQPHRTFFAIRAHGALTASQSSCSFPLSPGDLPLVTSAAKVGSGPMDSLFEIPHAEIGHPGIVRTVSGQVTGDRCPLRHANTVLCSLTWQAKVTFTRDASDLFVPLVPERDAQPAPPEPQAPPIPVVPPAPPTPPSLDDVAFVPLVPEARVTATGATLPVRCSAACSGTIVATAAGGRSGRAAALTPVLARKRFSARADAVAKVRLRFRRPLRRGARVRAAITVRTGGQTVRRTVVLRRR